MSSVQEEELKSAAQARLQEVLADVDARVQSGNGAGTSAAGGELYSRLSAAVDAIQEGLIERDVEVRSSNIPLRRAAPITIVAWVFQRPLLMWKQRHCTLTQCHSVYRIL